MNFVQLFINDPATVELDLNTEIDIAIQYSIADIKDISKRNAAYSKTVVVPGTKKNNYWFGNLFDINSDFSQFNPNKKTAARLLINTETVIEGFLQLRKINKSNETDPQGNQINYEVVLFNNTVDLMSALGEKTINELDLSQFGHTFSAANIKASWNNTWQDGYVYPMFGLQSSSNDYKPEYFYPSIFYRTILDQMIREAGFGWTGSLINNNQFNHEVISYVTDGRPKIDEEERKSRQFYVGLTPSVKDLYIGNLPNTFTGALPLQIGTPSSYNGFVVPLNNESSPFYDNGNNWDSTLYVWDIDSNGQFSAQYQLYYDANIRNTSGTTTVQLNTTVSSSLNVRLTHYLEYSKDGGSTWLTWDTSVQNISYTQATIAPGASASKTIDVRRQAPAMAFNISDKVRLRVRGWQTNYAIYAGTGGNFTPTLHMRLVFKNNTSTGGTNFLKNTAITADFTQNDYIELARYLPDKVKQKDLLTDLIRRYNLYIQTDPNNPRVLIFDPRPSFYEKGTIIDWTKKKDYSQNDDIELLSDLQYKLMIWSYKPDNDLANSQYQDVTGDVYGQYKYYFDNDFVKGQNRIESTFSPSPLIKTTFNAIVPAINPEQPKVQPRIFYYGGLRDCSSWYWTYQDPATGATGSTESFSKYPYAGHFDDPIEPEIDINFGTSKFYFYNDWEYITDNNMFNTYWDDYVRQIENGRLVTSYFYLDEGDIRFIKDNFYTKIFVLDSYYYVNKIIDYKPLKNGLTKVELLKIVDGLQWKPKRTERVIVERPRKWYSEIDSILIGKGNISDSGIIYGDNNISSGVVTKTFDGWEETYLSKNMIIGNNNNMSSDAGLIVGHQNTVISDFGGVILGGNNNLIEADGVVLLGVSNAVVQEPGKIYLGNEVIIDAQTGSFSIPSGSIYNTAYIEDTYANILATQSAGNLVPSGTYHITDKDIWIKALDEYNFIAKGVRKMPVILDSIYTGTVPSGYVNNFGTFYDYDGNTLVMSDGDFCLWGGKVWLANPGPGATLSTSIIDAFDLDTVSGTLNPIGFTFSDFYEEFVFDVDYDFVNDKIIHQWDKRGNHIYYSEDVGIDYSAATDWGSSRIFNNTACGILNNSANMYIFGNKVDLRIDMNYGSNLYYNTAKNINGNFCDEIMYNIGSGPITGNKGVAPSNMSQIRSNLFGESGIYNNIINQYIRFNKIGYRLDNNTANRIDYNESYAIFSNNMTSVGNIEANKSLVISSNTNGGSISNNTGDYIQSNTNGGSIGSNTFRVINGNSNTGDINYNRVNDIASNGSNVVDIESNMAIEIVSNDNVGNINNNNITFKIENNTCGGSILENVAIQITDNSNTGGISNNIIANLILNNSNTGSILSNKSYNISDNANLGDISSNITNGDISLNSGNTLEISGNNCKSISSNSIGDGSSYGNIMNNKAGNITGNSNSGDILGNTIGGDIIDNSIASPYTLLSINNNNISGNIDSNSNSGDIINNSGGGDIAGNSNTGDISANIVGSGISGMSGGTVSNIISNNISGDWTGVKVDSTNGIELILGTSSCDLTITNLPATASISGQVWNDSGYLRIVP